MQSSTLLLTGNRMRLIDAAGKYIGKTVTPDWSNFTDTRKKIFTGLLLIQHRALHVYNHAVRRLTLVLQESLHNFTSVQRLFHYLNL